MMKKISIIQKVREGKLTAQELKRLLNTQPWDGKLPAPWPKYLVTKIAICTTWDHVFLNYNSKETEINGEVSGIVVANRRTDARFKMLDADSEYEIIVPDPGIDVLALPRYFGPMQISQVMTEADFMA